MHMGYKMRIYHLKVSFSSLQLVRISIERMFEWWIPEATVTVHFSYFSSNLLFRVLRAVGNYKVLLCFQFSAAYKSVL